MIKCFVLAVCTMLFITSCGNNPDNMGTSQPIDSTNMNGQAPATYGGDDPAQDQRTDSNRTNVGDTGTKADNVHNTGTYEKGDEKGRDK